jgi:NADH:ubiquinone oxidoreductase subunit H
MENTYPFLGFARVAFKVLAWIVLSVGTLVSLLILFGELVIPEIPGWMGLVWLIGSLIYFFFLFVASEVIHLLLDIKEGFKR